MKLLGNDSASWLPEEATRKMIEASFAAMQRLAEQLKTTDFDGMSDKDKGQLLAYIAKAVDGMVRLNYFSRGEADSRVEVVGLSDLLKYLSNDQFAQVQTWIADGQAAAQARDVSVSLQCQT